MNTNKVNTDRLILSAIEIVSDISDGYSDSRLMDKTNCSLDEIPTIRRVSSAFCYGANKPFPTGSDLTVDDVKAGIRYAACGLDAYDLKDDHDLIQAVGDIQTVLDWAKT